VSVSQNTGSVTIVVEEPSLGPPHSVVAVIGHPLAASGQFQMATDRRHPRPSDGAWQPATTAWPYWTWTKSAADHWEGVDVLATRPATASSSHRWSSTHKDRVDSRRCIDPPTEWDAAPAFGILPANGELGAPPYHRRTMGVPAESVEDGGSAGVLEPRLVGDITGHFFVPGYQRGYRWGRYEVLHLLRDIEQNDGSYFLQPVVVKQLDGQWELVDGQQRLTTLYLILQYIQEHLPTQTPKYTMEYETRPESDAYLDDTSDALHLDIDFFHIWQARQCIRERRTTTRCRRPSTSLPGTRDEALGARGHHIRDQARGDELARCCGNGHGPRCLGGPRAGRVDFTTFAIAWLRDHPNLRARTRENYAGNLRNHILPVIGAVPLNQLSPSVIRRWHAELSRGSQLSPSTVAKCYRLVHAILETAVADELIVKKPCLVAYYGVGAVTSVRSGPNSATAGGSRLPTMLSATPASTSPSTPPTTSALVAISPAKGHPCCAGHCSRPPSAQLGAVHQTTTTTSRSETASAPTGPPSPSPANSHDASTTPCAP
jgi:hypothetical protein